MTWRDEPMLGADTETDGPNPEEARIVTACAGWASVDGWKPRNWILRPDRPIDPAATAIHGVTTEYATEHGMERRQGLIEIRDALEAAWKLGLPSVFFNAPFDLTVLDRELHREGVGGLTVSGPVLDGLVADKALDKYRRGSRKLVDVCAHHGITLTDAHTADADALAAVRLVWKLAPGMPDTLVEAHEWTRNQYAEQRRSFIEYRRRKGEPLDDESTDWPIRSRKLVTA